MMAESVPELCSTYPTRDTNLMRAEAGEGEQDAAFRAQRATDTAE
jgi:hypothetical protein